MVFETILLVLSVIYILQIAIYVFSWLVMKEPKSSSKATPKTSVSILIPCRNEEERIQTILADLSHQHYPQSLLEVLVLDDFSNDNTAQLANSYFALPQVRVISIKDYLKENESSKKAALTIGVKEAKGDLILTIDADCRINPNWIKTMVDFYEVSNKKIYSGPILIDPARRSIQHIFEGLDIAGMMIITGGMHKANLGLLCNGANLAFEKKAFEWVNGYEGKDRMPSGDDVFLMEKIDQKFPGSAGFIKDKNAIVRTAAQGSWKDFINQRTRWASKNHQYDRLGLPIQLLIPVLLSWLLFIGFLLAFFDQVSLQSILTALAAKVFADLVLQIVATSYFNRSLWLIIFPVAEVMHVAYLLHVAVKTLVGGFTWKGRRY